MEIKYEEKYNYDCSTKHYHFIEDNCNTQFYQLSNRDLVFTTYVPVCSTSKSYTIKKEEYYQVYMLINNMLKDMHKNSDKYGYNNLFYKGYFSWKSDALANEDQVQKREDFIYNYFNIKELKDAFQLEFINNTNRCIFCVEVNTDRSRYGSFRFNVWDLFNNMKEAIDNSQITIDEYIYCLSNKELECKQKVKKLTCK